VFSAPARLRIPSLAVDASVERLHRLADGTVDVPHAWDDTGWYADGPRPGEPGPSVLLGHVDSTSGPAVFARLRELSTGDRVDVVDSTGAVLRFTVERVQCSEKRAFPTKEVYLPTLRPELRLVTCGGRSDRISDHYVDNAIAFASLRP